MKITFYPLGEAAVKCCFPEDISAALTNHIQSFCKKLDPHKHLGITEWVPAYDSVTIYYEPWKLSYEQITNVLQPIANEMDTHHQRTKTVITIPTVYGSNFGPDLENLAAANNLSTKDVINLHTKCHYLINMIGFLPGFPYLSGLDERIAMPRFENPRQSVPAGSVGIAESQTGIYPLESPGGWNLIGRTPLTLFDAEKEEPFLFEQGDYLQFKAISEDEYKQIQREMENGTYKLERREESE
ncbi:5-oxoprolinase subunit PxpB [Bacillus sp. RAR_GA_16]|uniref:5-oxoprolinase subunit PxpB n=1 Tax=Bacillus sp. RAR_GA_16 TaxID=2876774 RepID=UPI001CCEB064|nr:5-oxoprolinase subunit PxpB [Bacillus sp. RAR_GA_16]MCA0170595.1 5-oxoprolinase subunit PxpB [Bacillus sp. RAR_GA_16]